MLIEKLSPEERIKIDLVHVYQDGDSWIVSLDTEGCTETKGVYLTKEYAIQKAWLLSIEHGLPLYSESEDDYTSIQMARMETTKGIALGTLQEVVEWQCEHQGTFAGLTYAGISINVDEIEFDGEELHETIERVKEKISKNFE